MEEIQLVENKELRERNIGKVEVLAKVGGLLMLPGDMWATTKQVANFYGVSEVTIRTVVKRNYDELAEDGYGAWKAEDFRKFQDETFLNVTTSKGKLIVTFKDGNTLEFGARGVGLFTKRAILRVGMLLRDSEVAKEVRTRLLNIYDASYSLTNVVEKEVDGIKAELDALATQLGKAMLDGDYETYLALNTKANALKAKQLQELESKLEEQQLGENGIYTGDMLIKFFQNEGLVNSYASVTMFNEWMATMGYMSKPGKFYTPTEKFTKELANKGWAFTRTTKSGNIRAYYRIDFVQLMLNHHMDSLRDYISSKTKAMTKTSRERSKANKAHS